MQAIKVSIVDDHALFRRGVADIVRETEGFMLMSEYGSGAEFLQSLQLQVPDLILLDLHMPYLTGLDVLEVLRQQYQHPRVIVLTASNDDQNVVEAIRFGANGFLHKDSSPEQIEHALQQVMQGQTVMNAHSVNVLAEEIRHYAQTIKRPEVDRSDCEQTQKLLAEMTQREQETLKLIAKGLNNKLIARELGISDGTVKVYVKNLLRKLNLHSRLELSVWVHEHVHAADMKI